MGDHDGVTLLDLELESISLMKVIRGSSKVPPKSLVIERSVQVWIVYK